jgi:hypothetical protein
MPSVCRRAEDGTVDDSPICRYADMRSAFREAEDGSSVDDSPICRDADMPVATSVAEGRGWEQC